MNQRHKEIIIGLIHNPMSIKEVSKRASVTERTIRNDIRDINVNLENYGASLVKNSKNEIEINVLDSERFEEFEKDYLFNFDFNFSEPKYRLIYIGLRFLFTENYLKLEDLMEEMYISRSTIKNDMKDVRDYLKEYSIDFVTKPHYGLRVVGNERDIRNAISTLINSVNEGFAGNKNHELSYLFDKEVLDDIYDILVQKINKSSIKLSDIALNNLVLHIAIAIKRIQINHYFESSIDLDLESNKEYVLAKEIISTIERKYDITFPNAEITYITMHLMGTKLIVKQDGDVILSQEEEELFEIARRIINTVGDKLQYNLKDDPELLTSIVMHLKPAIYRYHNNMNIRNPLLDSIKTNYSDVFDAALLASEILVEKLGINFNEDELGYIAIHLGTAIERVKLEKTPLKTLVVCTTGVGSSKLLKYKLNSKFGEFLDIIDTTEMYNVENYLDKNLELIITTVPFNNKMNIPQIFISDILGDLNFEEIKDFIESKRKKPIKFLDLEDVYINLEFNSKLEVLEYLTSQIVENHNEDKDLLSLILEREKIVTTALGNLVAVPHPIKPITKNTFLTIATLKQPIDWDGKKVQLVVILNVSKDADVAFEEMYEILLETIDSEENVNQILNSKNEYELYKLFTKGR